MAMEAFRAGQIDLKQFLKTMFIYHVLLPVMFQFAADMFLDPDDDKKRKLRAAIVGSLNGYFIVGQIVTGLTTNMLNAFMDEDDKKLDKFEMQGLVPQAVNQLQQLNDDVFKFIEEPSFAQVFEVIKEVGETGQYLTPFPTPQVINIAEGLDQMLNAETEMDYYKGFGQVAGWSGYVLNKALADKSGSKKKDLFNQEVIDTFDLYKKDSKDFNRVFKFKGNGFDKMFDEKVDYKGLFDKL